MMNPYFIPTPFEKETPVILEKRALTPTLTTADLPARYLQLLADQNGGYVKNMVVPTLEPTSDGLDCAHLHYIYGLSSDSEKSIPYQDFLPDYFIIFSAHEACYFAFDYSISGTEPAIRYLDTETDNWQEVASDFDSFLQLLRYGKIYLPLEGYLSRTEAEHAFLLVTDHADLEELFEHLEGTSDKEWYFAWINHFAQMAEMREVAFRALETQILYFRLVLPDNAQAVFDLFPEKQEWIETELAADF